MSNVSRLDDTAAYLDQPVRRYTHRPSTWYFFYAFVRKNNCVTCWPRGDAVTNTATTVNTSNTMAIFIVLQPTITYKVLYILYTGLTLISFKFTEGTMIIKCPTFGGQIINLHNNLIVMVSKIKCMYVSMYVYFLRVTRSLSNIRCLYMWFFKTIAWFLIGEKMVLYDLCC